MDESTRAVHALVHEINQNQEADAKFYRDVKRHATLLRVMAAILLFAASGAIGIALISVQHLHQSFVDNVVFFVGMVLLLLFTFLIANWLRVFFQRKIDQANASRYGNGWSK